MAGGKITHPAAKRSCICHPQRTAPKDGSPPNAPELKNKFFHATTPRRQDFKKNEIFTESIIVRSPPVRFRIWWPHRKVPPREPPSAPREVTRPSRAEVPPRDPFVQFPSFLGVFASLRDIHSVSGFFPLCFPGSPSVLYSCCPAVSRARTEHGRHGPCTDEGMGN
jgi:hypothetical protein